ncbi:MAG: conjugative coupling factor TraD, PFGI-1 class, partial [Candidatus Competibacteraceae bacterium]|nr:conjugative coupling factor TraD, PFGI-1 class [Candidatus Competibacteraceae bacterium]
MSARYPIEALLRPPVEWTSTLAAWSVAALAASAPSALLMTPAVAYFSALVLGGFGFWRLRQGWRVRRYQRGLRRLRVYRLRSNRVPYAREWLFLGRGFRWTPQHTQRLWDATRPQHRRYLETSRGYATFRRLGNRHSRLRSLTAIETWWNPLQP